MLEKSLLELMKQAVREVLAEKPMYHQTVPAGQKPDFDPATSGRIVGEPIEEHAKRTKKVKEAPKPEPEVKEEVKEVSLDDLRKKCADIAAKLGTSDKVKACIASFGGKVADVPAERRAEALAALDKLVETSTDSWE